MLPPPRLVGSETRLFVYGTLMSGFEASGFLRGLPALPARARGRLYRLPAGYPALVCDGAGDWVEGELVTLDTPERLALLDHYEGVSDALYAREVIRVAFDGRSATCWAYVMTERQARLRKAVLLKSGSWRRYRSEGI